MLIAESEKDSVSVMQCMYKSSCATSSEARWKYGFERMDEKAAQVEACIKQAEEIHLAVDELARTQDKCLLESLGIQDDSSSESDHDEGTEVQMDSAAECTSLPDVATLLDLLSKSQFNWFEFVEWVELMGGHDPHTASSLEEFFLQIPHLQIDQSNLEQYSRTVPLWLPP